MSMAEPSPQDPAFYSRPGLHVEVYDQMHGEVPGGADVAFFRELATAADGPVLELGCGTGRVTVPLAEAGISITGLDRSRPMLDIAQRRRRARPPDVRRRLRFVEADMREFRLGRRFGLVFAAFRVFMALPDPASQRAALATIRRHLRPGGLLVIDAFDPRLDLLTDAPQPAREIAEARHPETGHRVRITVLDRFNDQVSQQLTERWRFAETDERGALVREEIETLILRWTYRHELHHLLELAGFEVVAEYSDYAGSAPAYGNEIIVVARRRGRQP
jgi:SAM-dependent methyltransferase